MKRLDGKVVIVTASTYGIGFAIAKRLAEEGANVVVSSRKEANVRKAVDALKKITSNVIGVRCHVANSEDRKRLFDETMKAFGKLNILVSNAAVNPFIGSILHCEESVWDKIFDVNVKASFLLAREALPYIRQEGPGGCIVFVSSIAGLDPAEFIGAYSISKTALLSLTKIFSRELAREGIRVNCLAPGIVYTKFSAGLLQNETQVNRVLTDIPMGRFGKPDEMGGVVAFLVSDDASFITGETIIASGGMKSRL